jgi:hypothetical protein
MYNKNIQYLPCSGQLAVGKQWGCLRCHARTSLWGEEWEGCAGDGAVGVSRVSLPPTCPLEAAELWHGPITEKRQANTKRGSAHEALVGHHTYTDCMAEWITQRHRLGVRMCKQVTCLLETKLFKQFRSYVIFRLSRRRVWRWLSSGILRRVVWAIALKFETVSISETSVNFYQTTRRNIPEGS